MIHNSVLSGAEKRDAKGEDDMALGLRRRSVGARCDSSRAWDGDRWLGGCSSEGAMLSRVGVV